MSTKITTIISTLRTGIPLLSRFIAKKELRNAIDVESNPRGFLDNGWGLRLDSSSEGTIDITNTLTESRQFSIVITREARKLNSDIDGFMADQVELMEDHAELAAWLMRADQLGIPNDIGIVNFVGNSGVELVQEGNKKIIYTVTTVSIDILEDTGC